MFNTIFTKFILLTIILIIYLPQSALAYLGPGAGLSAIGSFLALLAGIIIAILGFLWYPIKRLFGKKTSQKSDQDKKNEK